MISTRSIPDADWHVRSPDWPRVLALLGAFKAAYLGLIYLALRRVPDLDRAMFSKALQRWPREDGPVFGSHFATWDAAHYLFLSELGYAESAPSSAFYPLWPLVIRGVAELTGAGRLLVGMLLANVFSLVGWTLFYRLVAGRFGSGVGRWSLVLLVTFPGALFYQFIYTESLFLLLLMVLWYGLERDRPSVASFGAFLLPLCRPVGVFCLLPIGWHLLRRDPPRWLRSERWLKVLRCDNLKLRAGSGAELGASRPGLGSYCLLAAPLLGWGLYLTLMWNWTGNPFEGFTAQRHFGSQHSVLNLIDVPGFFLSLLQPTQLHGYTGSLLDRFAFVLLLWTLPLIWKTGRDMVVWAYVLAIVPAMSGMLMSFTRYESTVFPLFIALALPWVRGRPRCVPPFLVACFALLHVVLLWRFVNFRWAG